MSGDPGIRRLLPQNSQMQNFSFAPTNFGPRENQKNYVFVDEHNRHKRLKVMRACEGCRRRKIKCDAATTNTWPCSACIRLKLHCVPPTVNYDGRDFPNGTEGFQPDQPDRSEYETGSGEEDYHRQVSMQQHLVGAPKPNTNVYSQLPYNDPVGVYQQPMPYNAAQATNHHGLNYANMQPPINVLDGYQQPQHSYPTPLIQHQSHHQTQPETPEHYQQENFGEEDLADLLGGLKVNAAGTAPFLDHKQQLLVEEPILEEVDELKNVLPPLSAGPDLKIRIPPELMPEEETAMHYFDLFFSNVHPYVPVLNKTMFYHQWHTSRESISPIILEAIFAIAGRLDDDPAQGQQWLALASKHLDSFADVPRLSTLQAMLLILKARESVPKRGYYYRSWMMVVQCVQMAKDLGLGEHYEEHKAGRPCGSTTSDCINRTRIWQTIFVCELMVGSPQGRTDLAVDMDSLDVGVPRPVPGDDDSEYHVTRNFTYFTRVVKNVRRMNKVYARIKNTKQWGIDPEFVQLNPSFEAWMSDLPADLQITFPSDGSSPWLPSHFLGNLHTYYYLSIIMLHRPQLAFMDPSGTDGSWKHHMLICYSSAKLLCRVQEGLLQIFGLQSLLCMQRGINFTIYCILTCTVLHLVALTSPDPDLSADARDYFTRHMRMLEKCTRAWPSPDIHMQQQIDALREAFSADIRKPFVLKPTFPYGSPSSTNRSPPRGMQYRPQLHRTSSMEQQQSLDQQHQAQLQSQVSYTSHPISPPISAGGGVDNKSDSSPAVQSLVMMATGQRTQQPIPTAVPIVDPAAWNPNRIFEQWNTSFGTPAASTASAPPPLRIIPPTTSGTSHEPSLPEATPTPNSGITPTSHQIPPPQYSAASIPSFVSPSMWQESVASVYEGGLKRQWDYEGNTMINQISKRPR